MTLLKCSPLSSRDGGESAHGTPDTKITAFSPEDIRSVKPSVGKSPGTLLGVAHHDPFVTAVPKQKTEQKLSATASAFQPYGLRVAPMNTAPIPGTTQHLNAIIAAELSPSKPAEITHFGIFTTDTGATRNIQVSSLQDLNISAMIHTSLDNLLMKGYKLMGSRRMENDGQDNIYFRLAHIGDALAIYKAIKADHKDLLVEFVSTEAFARLFSPSHKAMYTAHEGQVILQAPYPTSSTVSKKAFEDELRGILSVDGSLCAWQKLNDADAGVLVLLAEFHDASMVPRAVLKCDGMLIYDVCVSVTPYRPDIPANVSSGRQVEASTPTRRSAEPSGLVGAMGRMSINQTPGVDVNHGSAAASVTTPPELAYMTGNTAYGFPATALPVIMNGVVYTPAPMAQLHQQYAVEVQRQRHYAVPGFTPLVSPTFQQHVFESSMVPVDQYRLGLHRQYSPDASHYDSQPDSPAQDVTFFNRPSGHRQNAAKVPRITVMRRFSPNPAASHHNHVDIERIRHGIDVRTTVMLRNIPNKVDQAMLKSIIDESSFGKYDFMYLRIDFSNNCNVGYAFINFTDPLDIVDFVIARSNQKWFRFKSDKVAEVSYATIQGKDCLIQKFRNSSVMLEPPHYRPKLFFTFSDPFGRAGQEDEFPSSDNASKLKRSCENAEHVGLFAPSAGQHLRDEQRRRRSQYDRGTSLAEREEFNFDEGLISAQASAYLGYHPHY